jgi:MSHA biogenesis protein MshG
MAIFFYTARNNKGELKKGTVEASDEDRAADRLIHDSLTPIHIKKARSKISFPNLFFRRAHRKDLIMFCRQAHVLLKAGVPLLNTFQKLSELHALKGLSKTLREINESLVHGIPLSQAMLTATPVFSPFVVGLVQAAESIGKVDKAFLYAAEHYALEERCRKQIQSAFRYPVFVIVMSILAAIVLNIFVIPRFSAIYQSFSVSLPLSTRIMMGFSLFIQKNWPLLAISMLGFLWIGFFLWRHTRLPMSVDRWKFHIPFLGKLFKKILLANFCRSLSLQLRSGVSLPESLARCASIVNNHHIKHKILALRDLLERGETLSVSAKNLKFLSPLVVEILSVGEAAGEVDTLLVEAAALYEEEIDFEIKHLTSHLEPLLLLVVGGLVLMLGLGVFLPMWNLVYFIH